MKKIALIPLLLSTLVMFSWTGASPVLAYYAPLQDVTGPTVVHTTDTKVNVSVFNPATGQNIPGVWSTAGGAGEIAVDQIVTNQGLVAWRVRNLTTNKYLVVCGVYDPNLVQGWQFFSGWEGWSDYAPNIKALNDGVLLYEFQFTTGSGPDLRYVISEYMASYDPALEMPDQPWIVGWRQYSHSYTDYTQGAASGHVVKDGVVAYIYYSASLDWQISYMIYDSRIHGWMNQFETNTQNPTALAINAATVTWTDNTGAQKRGYDNTDQTWYDNQDTKVMANFVFAPFAPKVNQFVYFTDMSIAANAWSWTLGDGAVSAARSPYHKYTRVGHFAVQQQVTGPAGTDTNNQTVPVKAPSIPEPLLLLEP